MAEPGALDLSERRLLERDANVPLNAAWDPDPLQAGDRVVVKLSGECAWCEEFVKATLTDLDGRTGTVVAWPHTHDQALPAHEHGHDITVQLDTEVLLPSLGTTAWGGCLARAELQRIVQGEADPPNGA